GWTRRPRGGLYAHSWRPPDPADPRELVVAAACPGGRPREEQERDGFAARGRWLVEAVRTASLAGEIVALDGDAVPLVCPLQGPAHVYALRLDVPRDGLFHGRALLRAVVRSIRPVPTPRAAAGERARAASEHWAE